MMYIGIDIGKTGAVGFLDQKGEYAIVLDLPIEIYQKKGKGKKERWRIDAWELAYLIKNWFGPKDIVTIEDIWANATNGALASFGMGRMLGAIEALVIHKGFRLHTVAPTSWKRHFFLIGKDKDDSLTLAREVFPTAPLKLKKHHNRAEALLIARYAWEAQNG